jgi:hypothetical protein
MKFVWIAFEISLIYEGLLNGSQMSDFQTLYEFAWIVYEITLIYEELLKF